MCYSLTFKFTILSLEVSGKKQEDYKEGLRKAPQIQQEKSAETSNKIFHSLIDFVFIHLVKPRFSVAGCTVANCGLFGPQPETVQPAVGKRSLAYSLARFYMV